MYFHWFTSFFSAFKHQKGQTFSRWAAIMTAAFRHAQTGKQTLNCRLPTLFSRRLKHFLIFSTFKKNMWPCLECHAWCSRPCRCDHLDVPSTLLLAQEPVTVYLLLSSPPPPPRSLHPSLPTVLSYLLLSSSPCCHSVTLHLLTPVSLAPTARPSPLATASWKMRGNYLFRQLRFFSHLCLFSCVLRRRVCGGLLLCSPRRHFGFFYAATAVTPALWSPSVFVLRGSETANFLPGNKGSLHIQHVHRNSLSVQASLSLIFRWQRAEVLYGPELS